MWRASSEGLLPLQELSLQGWGLQQPMAGRLTMEHVIPRLGHSYFKQINSKGVGDYV